MTGLSVSTLLEIAIGMTGAGLEILDLSGDSLLQAVTGPGALVALGRRARSKLPDDLAPVLVQEGTGFHLSISMHLDAAARHAASMVKERYDLWLEDERERGATEFTRSYFTIAVGGGNTVKAEFRDLIEHHAFDIDWIQHVRFFFLEESSGEASWESAKTSLIDAFLRPLLDKLAGRHGIKTIAARLELEPAAKKKGVIQALIETMTHPINLSQVKSALDKGDEALAWKLARRESARYRASVKDKLGSEMAFHLIITGISKDGGVGAFAPYTPALSQKEPGVVVLEQENGALRLALNRGVFVNAECISLVVSGSLKLKALGRFEMEESADFETTVMETPLRMLRETYAIAEKVHIFADDRALHFDEGLFEYREGGRRIVTKAEVREGSEENGIHILLLHGFMGLYSYINFLIRLPSAWTVSALRRGSHAKRLPDEKVFPHYAKSLRKAILQNWRDDRPTPTGFHSMAGPISDHLLLSIVGDVEGPLPAFEDLKQEDQALVEALRTGGMILMAAWVPSDICHIGQNAKSLMAHVVRKKPLVYGGPSSVYLTDAEGALELNALHDKMQEDQPPFLSLMMKLPGTEHFINATNTSLRFLFRKMDMQQRLSNREIPYALRIVGSRLLKKVSFYGLLKEIDAALHHTHEYQRRHLKALDIVFEYDIPYLSIVHEDDFMVSANRHHEEHRHLLARRMAKEGVESEEDLRVATRFVLLQREDKELPIDPLNPHLMIMSTSHEGDRISRQVTAAVTRFVNENVAAAIRKGKTKPLASVKRWIKGH